jgi:signal transduction histidine kinase
VIHAFLLILVGTASGLLVFWWVKFKAVLPRDRELGQWRGHGDDLKVFTLDVLRGDDPALFIRSANELGHRTLDALHKVEPGVSLWWVGRAPDGQAELVAHRGLPWSAGLPAFDAPAFRQAAQLGAASFRVNGGPIEDPFLREAAQKGYKHLRMAAWGAEKGTTGLLVAADKHPEGRGLERLTPFLEIAKVLATSITSAIDTLAGHQRAREALEGGLTHTLADLADTHNLLIERSRQIKTLQDVAGTLTSKTAQTQSTLSAIVSIVARALQADAIAFLLLDDSAKELVVQPGAYGLENDKLLYRVSLNESQSATVRVFHSGEPFITGDAQNDPRTLGHYSRLWQTHSLMLLPLQIDNRTIGVMRVGSFRKNYFTREHLEFMKVITKEAAVIVETAVLNKKLSETAEQLTALNRMKDDFVSTVSHEFKTPLTSIMGFLTVILDGETGALSEQQTKFLGIAMGSAKRLAGLVADLLDISRLEGGVQMNLQAHRFEKILKSTLDNYQNAAKESGKSIAVDVPAELPSVVCDERWIGLCLDNLVSNAIKFTKPGGKVHVELADKGEFLMVSVSDDGMGIPEQDKPRIFEKFYRAANRLDVTTPGTGLGLAIAREIVAKHGGKIWFDSELGRGSKFHFIVKVVSRAGALR